MRSKWTHIKEEAISLRRQGCSLKDIESRLGIARSTLSGWLRTVELTSQQRVKLDLRWRNALIDARKKAVAWHNAEKAKRFEIAIKSANMSLSLIKNDICTIELALALLYLGEGFKKNYGLGMGNSDPLILKFFLKAISDIYKIDRNKVRYDLHLRADQDPDEMRKFWSKELGIPQSRCITVSMDKRTIGRPTYSDYKGVCVINCGNIAIQRKLVYLSRAFCEQVISARSSIGRASH